MPFLNIPEYMPNLPEWCKRMASRINEISLGKTNNIIEVTLNALATSTVVNVPPNLIGEGTQFVFCPQTASAATEFGHGSLYVSARDVRNKQITISHHNSADTDKTFKLIFIG